MPQDAAQVTHSNPTGKLEGTVQALEGRTISALGPARRSGGPTTQLGMASQESELNPKAGLGAQKEEEGILSKENKIG